MLSCYVSATPSTTVPLNHKRRNTTANSLFKLKNIELAWTGQGQRVSEIKSAI
jgi:hypothetical protein